MLFPAPQRIRAILLDIEGTTTPVTFVYDVLFPYAAGKLERFIHQHFHDPNLATHFEQLKQQHIADRDPGLLEWREDSEEDQIHSLIAYARWLMERDSKLTPLKAIQGTIWAEGYARGELHGQVYPDVPRALRGWRQLDKRVYMYSSGSELAQKLLFQSTNYGDLTSLLQGFFDTRVGTKFDARSYLEIARRVSCDPQQVLFVSDSRKELEAAHSAGMSTVLAIRSDDRAPGPVGFVTIHSFDEIFREWTNESFREWTSFSDGGDNQSR
jgi:enolase-phosphatase E1